MNQAVKGKSSSGYNIMLGGLDGLPDLQRSMRLHHSHNSQLYQDVSIVQSEIQEVLPPTVPNMHEPDKYGTLPHHNNGEEGTSVAGNGVEMNCAENMDGSIEFGERKKESLWQRMKWTEKMVKLLITALSYIVEASSECIDGERRKHSLIQKIGKWRCVSRVMAERGYCVSPQQCEDKFNNLKKSYSRLIDLLGQATSCNVVKNPMLLNDMDISDKAKKDVMKILRSKHLFYEEMYSYHNRNWLYLPHDPDLQQSLWLVLRVKDGTQHWRKLEVKDDCGTHHLRKLEADVCLEDLKGQANDQCDRIKVSAKRLKQTVETEDLVVDNPWKYLDCNISLNAHPQNNHSGSNMIYPEGTKTYMLQKHRIAFHALHLEEQKLQIKSRILKLKKKQFQSKMSGWKQDRELGKMRLENEHLKLENEYMAIELKRKEELLV